MKAISIMQPWLFAICRMGKQIENRTWAPSPMLIGQRIALHAGKKEDDALPVPGYSAGNGAGTFSSVIAVATLAEIVRTKRRAAELGQERWWVDRPSNVGHLFADIVELPRPVIGVSGSLSYWQLPADIERHVLEQLASRPL